MDKYKFLSFDTGVLKLLYYGIYLLFLSVNCLCGQIC